MLIVDVGDVVSIEEPIVIKNSLIFVLLGKTCTNDA